jgi:hypothetical protein
VAGCRGEVTARACERAGAGLLAPPAAKCPGCCGTSASLPERSSPGHSVRAPCGVGQQQQQRGGRCGEVGRVGSEEGWQGEAA